VSTEAWSQERVEDARQQRLDVVVHQRAVAMRSSARSVRSRAFGVPHDRGGDGLIDRVVQPGQLGGPERGRVHARRQLGDAAPQHGVFSDHLRQVVADLEPLERVNPGLLFRWPDIVSVRSSSTYSARSSMNSGT